VDSTIADLEEQVAGLDAVEQARFKRLFAVSTTTGRLVPPPEMYGWIEKQFGSVAATEEQRIVKVTNLVTFEGALFNVLRASRPMESKQSADLQTTLQEGQARDTFANPLTGTPADTFGRIQGEYSITASNIAKYDGFHGVTIFNEYNPLIFSAAQLADYINTAKRWGAAAHAADPRARYFFLMWNCLWKSGASILHGHMQMTVTCDMHYARVEQMRRAAVAYRHSNGESYFADLFAAHAALGLQVEMGNGVSAIANLTPVKEKEVLLRGVALDDNMAAALYKVLQMYLRLGVVSFNVAAYMPPFATAENENWGDFPVLLRVVDRGDPFNRTADVGAMELYAQSVVSSDPFKVAAALSEG
jgi:hypothetical protein